MKSSFNTINCRRNDGSVKWQRFIEQCPKVEEGIIPFTLADCDFEHPKELREGLQNYLDTMVFGYTIPTKKYYDSVKSWFLRRHHWELDEKSILHSPGVLPAISNSIQAFTKEQDRILILSPVYYPFKRIIESLNRNVTEVNLIYENGEYNLDENSLEKAIQQNKVRVIILCSPHNPIGKVWKREELEIIVELCVKYNILIIDDEIHHDLIMPGHQHLCLPTLSKEAKARTILLTSTSKSFNLAGLRTSIVIIENDELRSKYENYARHMESGILSVNAFGLKATEIAYNECGDWLDSFILHIFENHKLVKVFFETNLPQIHVLPLEGTYLQWIDFNQLNLDEEQLVDRMEKLSNVYCDHGKLFGANGKGFFRMNLAYPQDIIINALKRIEKEFKVN